MYNAHTHKHTRINTPGGGDGGIPCGLVEEKRVGQGAAAAGALYSNANLPVDLCRCMHVHLILRVCARACYMFLSLPLSLSLSLHLSFHRGSCPAICLCVCTNKCEYRWCSCCRCIATSPRPRPPKAKRAKRAKRARKRSDPQHRPRQMPA